MAMSGTKDFDVVKVARSDGADTGPGYWPATAEKPPAVKKAVKDAAQSEPEKMTRAKPQMIRLDEQDPRFIEWRIKLGILLKQELAPHPDEGHAWYVNFPRGYWLYEKSKHLWVSGYPIKSKLFKSPQEFALHLIWLLSSSQTNQDCACPLCNPAETLSKLAPSMEENLTVTPRDSPVKAERAPAKTAAKITPVPPPVLKAEPKAKAAKPAATPSTIAPQPIAQQPPAQTAPQPVAAAQPPPLPQIAQKPQPKKIAWGLRSPYLFRIGELVWYQHGQTWRLGIIIASAEQQENHNILPIAYGSLQAAVVAKSSKEMRPFYAFSVPGASIDAVKGKAFDEIDWEALLKNSGLSKDLVSLDASKLAAGKIDISYSLWGSSDPAAPGDSISHYGAFFGAERTEIGDCLRVKGLPSDISSNNDNTIMGVYHMFSNKDNPASLFLRGNLYRLTPLSDHSAQFVPNDYLPLALRDETEWRDKMQSVNPMRWALVKEDISINEKSVRGRFYPLQRLMTVLGTAGWEKAVVQGQVEGQSAHLNSRMEGNLRYIGRRRNRLETLGASVPHMAKLMLEPYVKEEDQP